MTLVLYIGVITIFSITTCFGRNYNLLLQETLSGVELSPEGWNFQNTVSIPIEKLHLCYLELHPPYNISIIFKQQKYGRIFSIKDEHKNIILSLDVSQFNDYTSRIVLSSPSILNKNKIFEFLYSKLEFQTELLISVEAGGIVTPYLWNSTFDDGTQKRIRETVQFSRHGELVLAEGFRGYIKQLEIQTGDNKSSCEFIMRSLGDHNQIIETTEENVKKINQRKLNEDSCLMQSKIEKLEKKIEKQEKTIKFLEDKVNEKNLIFTEVKDIEKNYEDLLNLILHIINTKLQISCPWNEIEEVTRKGKYDGSIRPVVVTFTTISRKLEILRRYALFKNTMIESIYTLPAYNKEIKELL